MQRTGIICSLIQCMAEMKNRLCFKIANPKMSCIWTLYCTTPGHSGMGLFRSLCVLTVKKQYSKNTNIFYIFILFTQSKIKSAIPSMLNPLQHECAFCAILVFFCTLCTPPSSFLTQSVQTASSFDVQTRFSQR